MLKCPQMEFHKTTKSDRLFRDLFSEKSMSKILVALAFALPVILVGCGGGSSPAALLTSSSNSGASSTGSSSSSSTTPTSQTITFNMAALAVGSTVQLQATASSGLPITYASQSPSTCTVSGSTVTAVALGSCTLTADQAGNASFKAASQVQIIVPVLKAQTITNFAAPSLSSQALVVLSPNATSGLPVTITSLTQAVCTVNQNIAIYAVTTGTCTLQASQSGSGQYAAAPSLTVTTTVTASDSSLAKNAVLASWITTPQTGSTTADSTTSLEGIYTNSSGSFAFIDSANYFNFYDFYGLLFGSFTADSTNGTWVLNSSPNYYPSAYNTSTTSSTVITANGNFSAKQSFTALVQSFVTVSTLEADGKTSTSLLYLTYSKDNGYAASQSSVAGNWLYNDGSYQFNLTVDNTGAITGTEVDTVGGACSLSGTITLADSGSQHNMYSISLSAVDGVAVDGSKAFCNIDKVNPYKGLAALRFVQAGANDSNGYLPSLVLLAQDAATSNPIKLIFLKP